jgi:flagellar protein FlaG
MDLRIGHNNFTPPPATLGRASAPTGGSQFGLPRTDSTDIGGVPATPPADALREVDRAAERADELWSDNRELHFQMDEKSGRVIVQVRDREGEVIRTIPPSEALDILAGKPI